MPVDLTTLDGDGLPTGLLQSLALAESGGRDSAVSPKGAVGRFQLMPATAAGLNVNPNDPAQNRAGAITYLKQLFAREGSWPRALEAYNYGPNRLDRSGAPPSVQSYAARVLGMPTSVLDQMPGMNEAFAAAQRLQQAAAAQVSNDPEYQAATKEATAGRADAMAALRQDRDQVGAIGDQLSALHAPDAPALKRLPTAPKEGPGHPARVLGETLPALAILGGALMGKHSLAALKAATGAMQGAHSADEEAIQRHHEQFKDALDQIVTGNKEQLDRFDAAIRKYEGDKAGLLSALQVHAAQVQDTLGMARLSGGHLDQYVSSKELQRTLSEPVVAFQRELLDQDQRRAQLLVEQQRTPPTTQAYNEAHTAWLEAHPGDTDGARQAASEAAGQIAAKLNISKAAGIERGIRKDIDGSPLGKGYNAAEQQMRTIEGFDGQPNGAISQAALVDAYTQLINGGRAIRGFQMRLNTDHAGLADKAAALSQQLGRGGALSPRMIEDIKSTARTVKDEIDKAYGAEVQRGVQEAERMGLDGQGAVPFDYNDPSGGTSGPPAGAPANARQAGDGHWYSPDPQRAGKWLRWDS